MNEKELIGKIHSSMYHQLQVRGYAAPVDVLIDTGILPKLKYEDWRFGRVRYLAESDADGISVHPSGKPCYATLRITRLMLCKVLCEVIIVTTHK